jgi:hypothetical protein
VHFEMMLKHPEVRSKSKQLQGLHFKEAAI